MVVKELMSTNVCFIKEHAHIQDAVALMCQYDIGFVPICNELGEISGILTDRDLITKGSSYPDQWMDVPVKEIMTQKVFTLSPDMDIHEAALAFSEKKLHRFPVLQGARLVGILSISDLAKKRVFLAEVGDIIGAITMEKYTKNK